MSPVTNQTCRHVKNRNGPGGAEPETLKRVHGVVNQCCCFMARRLVTEMTAVPPINLQVNTARLLAFPNKCNSAILSRPRADLDVTA